MGAVTEGPSAPRPDLCAPSPLPPPVLQKLKEEIADVFAQIDCFESAEER